MKPPFKTIIIDDKKSEIKALKMLLQPFDNIFEIVAEVNSYKNAIVEFSKNDYDVAIIDYELDGNKDCLNVIEKVSIEKRRITVFKTTTSNARLLQSLYKDDKILFISSFYTADLIEDFVDNLLSFYRKNFPVTNNTNFILKTEKGNIITPVSDIYLLKTLNREYTMFYLLDENQTYRSVIQNGRMQNHVVNLSNSNLFIPKRGCCINIKNVKVLRPDSTLEFKNSNLLPEAFPVVVVTKDKLSEFQELSLQ